MDLLDRLLGDLSCHPHRQRFEVERTGGPDLTPIEDKAVELGLLQDHRTVTAGLRITADPSSIHLPFFSLDEEQLAVVADQVQDFLVEHLGVVWPECPVHGDALCATMLASEATWVCQRDLSVHRRVGTLCS